MQSNGDRHSIIKKAGDRSCFLPNTVKFTNPSKTESQTAAVQAIREHLMASKERVIREIQQIQQHTDMAQ